MKLLKGICTFLKMIILGSTRISFTIPIGKLKFKVYECPGLWCSDSELDKITKDLLIVATNCQGDKEVPIYGVLKGEREDMSSRLITIAYEKKTNRPVGFSAQVFLDLKNRGFFEKLLHLGLIYVDKSAQGKNISYLLSVLPNILIIVKNGFRDIWVSNVSQVPAVVGLVAKNYYNVYPNVDDNFQHFYHKKLAELIIADHNEAFGVGDDAIYDKEKQIIKNAYTGGSDNLKKSFAASQKHRDERINELCQNELNYERGDDFIQLGLLSPQAILNLYRSKMGKGSIIVLTLTLVAVAGLSVFVPIVRWFVEPMNKTSENLIDKNEIIL